MVSTSNQLLFCCWFLLCDRRIWRKIDTLKSAGGLAVVNEIDEDEDEDESSKWSWYIS